MRGSPSGCCLFAGSGRSLRASPFPQLTPREHDVLEMIAQGLDNGTIARRLVLSNKSVRNRVSDILAKLHAGAGPRWWHWPATPAAAAKRDLG